MLSQTPKKIIFWMVLSLLGWCSGAFGQDSLDSSVTYASSSPLVLESGSTVSFQGFYRFLGFVRDQKETFPNNSGKTTAINVGDSYREPMLLLKLNGRTREGIDFGADFMINSVYKGPDPQFVQPLTLDLGLNLRAAYKTEFGNFTIRSGGVSWYRQSRLTVWGNRAFNRFSVYERRPQTPLTRTPVGRYSSYYQNGLIDDGVRYGSRAFQGVFLQGAKLPLGFAVKGVLGKSNFNRSYLVQSDNFTGAFQLRNDLSDSLSVAYNLLSSFASVDSLSNASRKYAIHTLEFKKKTKEWTFQLEAGLGKYTDPEYALGIGEALIMSVKPAKGGKIPLTLQAYRISPQFVNVTGNFLNTTVLEVFPNVAGVGSTVRTPFRSPMTNMGAPVNNRQGLSLNADVQWGRLKINGGLGAYAEIDTSSAGVSYIHQVNGQTLSRIFLFGQQWGPYNALSSTYRGVFEEVSISDTTASGMAGFQKFFNTAELQAKYQANWFGRDVYFFSLSRLNSCQKSRAILPQVGSEAVITQFSQEFDWSMALSDDAVLLLSYGIERVLGNADTDVGDATDPTASQPFFEWLGVESLVDYTLNRNQRNRRVGWGVDYKIGDRSMLFFRHSLYRYYDPNFIENHLQGSEVMLELKMMF